MSSTSKSKTLSRFNSQRIEQSHLKTVTVCVCVFVTNGKEQTLGQMGAVNPPHIQFTEINVGLL